MALRALGFAGALRRSELVALGLESLAEAPEDLCAQTQSTCTPAYWALTNLTRDDINLSLAAYAFFKTVLVPFILRVAIFIEQER